MKSLSFSFLLNLLSMLLYFKDRNLRFQWLVLLLWGTSILTLILPFFLKFTLKDIRRWLSKNHKEAIFLGLILLGAGLVRFYNLSEVPTLGHDEARDAGLLPEAILRGKIKDFFGYGVYGIPNMFFLLASLPHLFFPRTVLAVKFFAAFFGIQSVLVTYFLARKLFNPKIAIISASLLSFYHVHLHFSRSEFLNLFDSFWAPLLVWSLILATERDWYFSLLFGLIAGLSLHFYQGIRVVVLTSFLYLLAYLLLKQRRVFFKKISFGIFGLFIGLGPSLLVLLTRPSELFNTGTAGRPVILGATISELIKILPERILQAFGSTVYYPIDFHYRYGGPFLQFPANLFFLLGLIVILKKINHARHNLLLLWLGSVLFFNSAILHNLNFTHRLLALVPCLMIIVGLGMVCAIKKLKRYKLVDIITTVLLITVIALTNLKIYFIDEVWKKTLHLNTKVATSAGLYIKTFSPEIYIYFLNSSRMFWKSVPSWEYLNEEYNITDLEEENFYSQILNIEEENQKKVFIVLPEREEDFDILKKIIPSCNQRQFYFNGDFLFFSYECVNDEKKTGGKVRS